MTDVTEPFDPQEALLRSWRTASLTTVWRHGDDWAHPAAEALVEALETGVDPTPAAHRLGAARAERGSDMAETLDDLGCLFDTLGFDAPLEVTRAVAVGWAESQETTAATQSSTDPLTGLRTAAYLTARLEETYTAATPETGWCLLVLDVATEGGHRLDQIRVGALVGAALARMLGRYHPAAQLRPGLFAIMTRRDDALPATVEDIRTLIAGLTSVVGPRSMRAPARLWVERLPDDPASCAGLLSSLRS
ncbi:hypothetical protein ATL41_1397 [Flavimobilis soli]|uniref:GGDEF domain-containing protein n=1 Tax=Flavimobilis soli TaxID=442709 RepID=A0A2A9ECN3_9MICO|nr:hypothetical protein [Flavimobilis soli]PFG36664.1 hypothetical protein ATL41_1397 [Flavimobilis soli]